MELGFGCSKNKVVYLSLKFHYLRQLRTEELHRKTQEEFKKSEKLPLVVVLDNIRSLSNIGSVFRTSDAFLIKKILLCGITASPPHREIHKTALGATESVDWEYFDSSVAALKSLKEESHYICAAEQTDCSEMLHDFCPPKKRPLAVVFGNEVAGVSEEVLAICDKSIEIPQFGTKHSLNIAVSTGIILWELQRKIRLDETIINF